ncbi:TRAP transporter small permease protein [Synergistales bacterium]|nr:TRAP transporter small permease protein [Synergistales bacterium]
MKKFVIAVLRAQEALGTFLLAVFFVSIVVQIGARYAKISLLWTEEVANYSFIWAVFMGASAMLYHRAHFSFTFFRDKFRGKNGVIYDIFVCAALLSFTVPMFCYGIMVARTFWNYNWISLPWMKMGYTWLCLPIMGFTMSLYTVCHLMEDLSALKSGRGNG